MRCPFCGGLVVYDPDTGEYVCTQCGTVFGYEMVPSRSHLLHVTPVGPAVVLPKDLLKEIDKDLEELAEVVSKALPPHEAYAIITRIAELKKTGKAVVPWNVYRQVMLLPATNIDLTALKQARERAILSNIEEILARENYGDCEVTPEEVFKFAVANEHLWSGKHAKTVAEIFTYLYMEKKCGKKIKISRRAQRLIKQYRTIVRWDSG